MSIFVCGDIHSILDIDKLSVLMKNPNLTDEDYLIICGDTGICGFDKRIEAQTREYLRKLPVTVLFCDGNHENFYKLNDYPVDEWHGGKVHVIESGIIHLMRGQIYDICGKSFFVFGGANSRDKEYRTMGIDWFEEEMPSPEEYDEGLSNLESHNNEVDYIISHTGPFDVIAAMGYENDEESMPIVSYLQEVADTVDFCGWYFGHHHVDEDIDEVFHCLIDNVVELLID